MTYIEHDGFLWPETDNHCHKVIKDELKDIDKALAFDDRRSVAVQAGGNVGVWAAHLAEMFETVYTFEPDPDNYHCLVQNVPANVIHQQAALCNRPGSIRLEVDPKNVGAHYVNGKGKIPAITLDSLELPGCDYLCLDIEGFEPLALQGAEQTIAKYKPLIHIEEKGLSERYYGIAKGTAEQWLADTFGYAVVKKIRKDVILSCEPASS